MNNTEGLATLLTKKFKKFTNQENLSPEAPSTSTNGKNVSWVEYHEYDSDSKLKKPLRSTPYPNPLKKLKISNSTPKTLNFDDSDTDEYFPKEDTFTTFEDISKLCKPKSQGTKRKRSEHVLASSQWTVTSCNKIEPDKCNRRCLGQNSTESSESSNEDSAQRGTVAPSVIVGSDSEDDTQIQSTILSDFKQTCEPIIVRKQLTQVQFFDTDESEQDSDDLNSELVFKPKIQNLENCQIIQPKTGLPAEKKLKEKQISSDNKLKENQKEKKLDLPSNETTKPDTTDYENYIENKVKVTPKSKIRFSKVVKSFINETHCILFIKHPAKLYFHGKLCLSVLYGAVEILGRVLQKEKDVEVYSPRGQSYLCIETVLFKSRSKEGLKHKLAECHMPSKLIKEYLYHVRYHDSVIALKTLNNNVTNYLSAHIAQYLFPKPVQCHKIIEKKLHCLFETEDPTWKVYRKNEDWQLCTETVLNDMTTLGFSSSMLCGGKSVGKSTFFRYMINSLLNVVKKVVCIDLDPGQAEFTIGGCVSVTIIDKPILGPNFTHLKTPSKSFFVGDINIVNCIDRYIASVKDLLIYCEQDIGKEYPWVINYMGFSKSLGVDLTVSIIKLMSPNNVIQINSSMKSKNYPAALTNEYVENYIYSFPIITPNKRSTHNTIVLNSVAEEKVEGEFEYEARPLREMSILSYFSQIIEDGKEITSVAPYSVKLPSIKLHDLEYSTKNIPAAMNGNLVALCKTKAEIIDSHTVFDCFGFGIVRGIDLDSEELFLLTPVPENELENVNILIKGNITLPPSLYMTTGRQGLVPYIVLGTQQGTSTIPKRTYKSLKDLLKKK